MGRQEGQEAFVPNHQQVSLLRHGSVTLVLINYFSSAQTAFAVHFDNHKMKVVSADFTPIVPYETDTLWLASGQRYNVIVEMNQVSRVFIVAVQD